MQQVLNLRDLTMVERAHARGGRFTNYSLISGEDGTPGNFYMSLARTYDDFESPRHRHNFDQVRLQIEGQTDFARDGVMTPGMVGYFPEGVFYGPQSVTGNALTFVLQFGGASRSGYLSENQFQRGIRELKEVGTFEAGVYKVRKPEGGSRNKDAYEAVWEHMNGRELRYPESRYDKPLFMRPAAAEWIAVSGLEGVMRKHLGTFSEGETAIDMVSLAAGATWEVPAKTVVFVMDGKGRAAGAEWERHSALFSGDSPGAVIATEGSTLLQIRLPRI